MPRSNKRNTGYAPKRDPLLILSPLGLAQHALERLVRERWTGGDDSNVKIYREIFLTPDDATAFITALNDHLDRAECSGFIRSEQGIGFDAIRQTGNYPVTLSVDVENISALQDAANQLGVSSRGATIS